ncbi:hypothetical protein IE81DRAFT_365638 [Ceraceosorus guamensis]|uniref:Uncharacterized protein n=1 Tax=Ceraceosorus guamensis TaxID=1522189 RepID=A0A316W3B7_9BASI|nr:hypothetical protein IE81DRAFT_365638 [Ceraceosorus guamensis]PWN43588.1 hypothetical protein IE81DRAFT_365638 [Ceraceosorus guamensis]
MGGTGAIWDYRNHLACTGSLEPVKTRSMGARRVYGAARRGSPGTFGGALTAGGGGNAEKASSFNETERSSNITLMTVFYFTDYGKLDRWTRASAHGGAIKWWDEGMKQGRYKHLTIAHELYRVPRGRFESVYVNSALLGLSSTSVKTDRGWVRPVVDASIGALRTSRGRQAGIQASSGSPGKNDKASIYPRATAPPGFVSP